MLVEYYRDGTGQVWLKSDGIGHGSAFGPIGEEIFYCSFTVRLSVLLTVIMVEALLVQSSPEGTRSSLEQRSVKVRLLQLFFLVACVHHGNVLLKVFYRLAEILT